jgi:uncharacterized protein
MELRRSHAQLPQWLKTRTLQDPAKAQEVAKFLDIGEAEAIALAGELRADYLLIDERKGRRVAQQHGLPVVGVIGVVLIAKRQGLISSARQLLDRLHQEAGVYLTDALKETALKAVGE